MSDLNSHCPAIGTEIDIYLHSNRDISMTVSNFTLRSLIVGVYVHGTGQADWLLAWDTTNTPSAKYARPMYKHVGQNVILQSTFTKDVDQHNWYCWVNGNIEVATVHAKTPMVGAPSPFYGQLASLPATLPATPVAKDLSPRMFVPQQAVAIGEAPCPNPTCRKMNDIGIRKCWNCEGKL
jgi:hypothetical protein